MLDWQKLFGKLFRIGQVGDLVAAVWHFHTDSLVGMTAWSRG